MSRSLPRTSLLAAAAAAALAALAALAVGGARRLLLLVTVEGTSMAPTYAPGQRLLVLRTPVARVRTGAAVVFRLPPPEHGGAEPPLIVKRLAARAGDPVPPAIRPALGPRGDGRVPRGSVVVLGDNPEASTDSRAWGYVPRTRITGVVIARLPSPPG
ncbi:S26 family signal peptidase [Streptomyces cocklensis]|uniref:Signal peptidase I n=1 Tax=Actinacidiphila cocklensis TaxID=887465 RepID=A0A9W4DV97_9ACTN|nr:S26 family signal peptidase [Actinacidiphila cocklensis]MDD1063055.1 S26 family signal peptidase [Actinacidiphila cocklensis]CAG6394180.1 Signal peptidase I [Actinacidiphila cocklensis]